MQTYQTGWLAPLPPYTLSASHPPAEDLSERLGVDPDPLPQLEELSLAATAAKAAVQEARPPAGSAWRKAELADRELVLAGKKCTEVAKLMKTDPDRWSAWMATVSAVEYLQTQLGEVRERTRTPARTFGAGLLKRIESVALRGWENRDDKAEAWSARKETDELLRSYRWISAVVTWAEGGQWDPGKRVTPAGAAGGALVALTMYLDGIRPMGINPSYVYPAGFLDHHEAKPMEGDLAALRVQLTKGG